VAPYFNINRPKDIDAAIAKTGGPLPVITWGNGACMRSDAMWQTFYDRWASAGWFVLSLNTVPAGASGSSSITADDQDAMVDWVFTEVEKKGSPYAGKLDTKRVVAAGNSCGGVTALTVGSTDKRVTALFILAGSSGLGSSNATIMNGIKVPVCWIEGGTEELSRGPATSDYENLADDVPAMMVVRSSGDHIAISNDLTNHAQSAEISLNWLDLALYGTPDAYKVLTSKGPLCSGCEASLWTVLMSQNLDKLVKK
jgi:predicted dienelactone hydrolase